MAHKKMRYLEQSMNSTSNNTNGSSSNNNITTTTTQATTTTTSNNNINNLSSSAAAAAAVAARSATTTATTTTSSVKQLITTAATGNGVVDDVDELLIPMVHIQQQQHGSAGHRRHSSSPKRNDGKPERNLWSKTEMLEMLKIMHDQNAIEKLNDKTIKSESVFWAVEEVMNKNGYCKKSHVQIWTKWKFLKSTYNTTKRNGTIPKMIPNEVYEQLCKILDHSNVSSSGTSGDSSIVCSGDGNGSSRRVSDDSMPSMCNDGEQSNHGTTAEKSSIQNGAVSVIKRKPTTTTTNDNVDEDENDGDDNDLNMAHPIFGFRLIKPEPADTGYDTNIDATIGSSAGDGDSLLYHNQANSSSFEHIPFEIEVKQELIEPPNNANTPPPTAPASPTSILHKSLSSQTRLQNEPVETNVKRLGRHSSTIVPLVTSTPNGGSSWNSNSNTSSNSCTNSSFGQQKMPPLRVANFAKEHKNSAYKSGVMKIDNRMPSSSLLSSTLMPMKQQQQLRLNNTNDITFTQQQQQQQQHHQQQLKQRQAPRLILPKLPPPESGTGGAAHHHNIHQQQQQLSYLSYARLSKEIALQPTSRNINTSNLRLKQVPMRDTPYSLRPDRMIPDLDQSTSPPPSPVPTNANNHQHPYQQQYPIYDSRSSGMATTSRHAQAQSHQQHHLLKERKRRLQIDTDSIKYKHKREDQNGDDSYGGYGDYGYENNYNNYGIRHHHQEQEQQHHLPASEQQQKQHEAFVGRELMKLVDSLHETQREMMKDFFKHQKELAQREHEFQMKQDFMILQTFQKQTNDLMKSAKKILNVKFDDDQDDANGGTSRKKLPKNSLNSNGTVRKTVLKKLPESNGERKTKEKPAVAAAAASTIKTKNNFLESKEVNINNSLKITEVNSLTNENLILKQREASTKNKNVAQYENDEGDIDDDDDDDDIDDQHYSLKVSTDADNDSNDEDGDDEEENEHLIGSIANPFACGKANGAD